MTTPKKTTRPKPTADSPHREPYLPHSDPDGSSRISANNQTLMRQGPMTADEYLHSAIDHIDDRLGAGYAKAHPELVAAFMQTSALDQMSGIIARAIQDLGDVVGSIGPGAVQANG